MHYFTLSFVNFKKLLIFCVLVSFTRVSVGVVSDNVMMMGVSNSQHINIDSLEKELEGSRGQEKLQLLIRLSRAYVSVDLEKSLLFEKKVLELARDLGDTYAEVQSIGRLGQIQLYMGDHHAGMDYFMQAVQLAEKVNYPEGQVNSLIAIGLTYTYMCRYDSSLAYYHKALNLSEEIHYERGLSITLNNIGIIYANNEEYDKSYEFYMKALDLYGKLNDSVRVANAYVNLGLVHERNREYQEAMDFFKKAIPIFEKHNEEGRIASSYNSIGLAYYGLEDYSLALQYFKKSLELAKKISDKYTQTSASGSIGRYYSIRGHYDIAIQYLNEGLEIAHEVDSKEDVKRSYALLTKVYKNKKDYKKAFKYQSLYMQIEDSISTDNVQKKILELETKYESEKQEKEIELLQAQNEIKNKQNIILISFLVGLFIVAALAIYIFLVKNVALKRKALLLEQEKELDRLTVEKKELEAREKEAENLRLQEEMKSNEEISTLKEEKYQEEIKSKNRELSTTTLLVVGKNGILTSIKETIDHLLEEKPKDFGKMLKEVVKEIDSSINADKDWDTFKKHFEAVHSGFFERLLQSFPDLTHNELRLCAYMRINLNTKEIAQMLNISPTSVNQRRYRMRKKLDLESDVSLVEYMMNL